MGLIFPPLPNLLTKAIFQTEDTKLAVQCMLDYDVESYKIVMMVAEMITMVMMMVMVAMKMVVVILNIQPTMRGCVILLENFVH